MGNYQDYYDYADLDDRYPDQQQHWAVQNPSKGVQDPVQIVQNSRSEPFLRYRRRRSNTVQKRSVNEKAARNAENRRYGGLILSGFVIGLSACFMETLLHADLLIQVCSYLSVLCYFFALDPIRALYRSIAPQSRIILALVTVMAIVGLISQYQEYIIIASLLSIAGLFAIWKCNASWLASDNWMMSEYVQRAIRAASVDTARIDEVWQAYGRRECSTLLYEMGYDVAELDRIHRAVWLTGWMRGYAKTAKYQKKMEAAKQLREDYKYLKENYSALQKKNTEAERTIKELEARVSEADYQYTQIQKLYKQTKKENEQLLAANQELLEEIMIAAVDPAPPAGTGQPDPDQNPEAAVPPGKIIHLKKKMETTKEKSHEEKVLEALQAGMSLSEAGKFAGCSKSTAYNIKKAHDATAAKTKK
ncbi:MAG: hypothetical protein ACI4GD_02450 [Lachnospiraceae bacterium]